MTTAGDDDFDGLAFKDLPAYTQQPPATLDEISALIESFERAKKRLVVPTARVADFEAAVRAAGLGHAVTVVGHAWLEPGQAYLMASEAELEADMQAAVERAATELLEALRGQAKADTERLMADLEAEARQEREREYLRAVYAAPPPRWLGGISGI